MRSNRLVLLAAATLWPALASAEAPNWKRFEVPETNASVDVPADLFTKDGGKPETGFGAKLLTADGRANMTIQSMNNTAGETPSAFLARMNPPRDIVYKRVTSNFFVVSSLRKGSGRRLRLALRKQAAAFPLVPAVYRKSERIPARIIVWRSQRPIRIG